MGIDMETNVKKQNDACKSLQDFWQEEDGMGTVEIILIIVVLISLVIIFKRQLTSLVNSIFGKIKESAGGI